MVLVPFNWLRASATEFSCYLFLHFEFCCSKFCRSKIDQENDILLIKNFTFQFQSFKFWLLLLAIYATDQKKLVSQSVSSVAQLCPTLCDPMNCSMPGLPLSITNSGTLLRLIPIKLVMPSSHLILCRPLLFLPPIPPSIRVSSNESTLCMRWPKYWSFSFGISPSNEHPGLISFRMDWLDLLAVQGTLKSRLPTP